MQKKIVITGGEGRFAQVLKRDNKKLDILYPSKKELKEKSLIDKIIAVIFGGE